MSDNEEFVREFLVESAENLDQLDRDLVALEENPHDSKRLASIFRAVHTIKGTSGFFGFAKLGAITHSGEHLLGQLRDGKIDLDDQVTGALLTLVDAVREPPEAPAVIAKARRRCPFVDALQVADQVKCHQWTLS